MWTIYKKEIKVFFSSLIAYLVIGVFLSLNGIFLWLLPDSNILDNGYASLDELFNIAPWVFMFLIPAITMRFFAEERRSGTLETVLTKPISEFELVNAKFFAGLTLVFISILPTLVYFLAVYQLANPVGNVDIGATIGSYIGLLFIGAAYVAMGLFASSTTDNQIVSFILAFALCFLFYAAIDWVTGFPAARAISTYINPIGLQEHYTSISRGVIDTRDLVYFIGFSLIFIFFTSTKIQSRKW